MGEVDNPEHAEDNGKSQRKKDVKGPEHKSIEKLSGKELYIHAFPQGGGEAPSS
jgi:hypothetical protein